MRALASGRWLGRVSHAVFGHLNLGRFAKSVSLETKQPDELVLRAEHDDNEDKAKHEDKD